MSALEIAAELATGGGTLILAIATFASVRSANRTARLSELSLQEAIRPLLLNTRVQDQTEKFTFMENELIALKGGMGLTRATDDVVYFALSLRNVGNGLAVLQSWHLVTDEFLVRRPALEDFRMLNRDLYIAAGDQGFFQGALRDPHAADFAHVKELVETGARLQIDVLYGDHEGGQRVISRFNIPASKEEMRPSAVVRHWNLDRPDPRERTED